MNIFKIERKVIQHFANEKFRIPSYQRPYCWGKSEIEQLLNDIKDNVCEEVYFIGNVISIKGKDCYLDLVDGQQRFTTLWILSLYFYFITKQFAFLSFCKIQEKSRLQFAIRDKTNQYLEQILQSVIKEDTDDKFWKILDFLPLEESSQNLQNQDPSLVQNATIAEAFNIIDNWIKDGDNDLKKDGTRIDILSSFILEKLTFEFLVAPQGTDENKLFIQINSNGIQLQHYDILKAELLNAINENDRSSYARNWDYASCMYSNTAKNTEFYQKDFGTKVSIELRELIKANINSKEYSEDKINSITLCEGYFEYAYIVDFNTFLIHALFIFIKQQYEEDTLFNLPKLFNSEKLLEVFKKFRESISEHAARKFIDLLVQLKELIEKHIIVQKGDSKKFALLASLQKESEDEYTTTNLEQLQRMLYHSSNNEYKFYWLGVFLDYLLNDKDSINDDSKTLLKLESIDNIFSLSVDKFEKYIQYFSNNQQYERFDRVITDATSCDSMVFGKINRYWFYKLEYLLWKNWGKDNKAYIITSKNSIEHIIPQSFRRMYENEGIEVDKFANLVLITVSENSGFSNKNILGKREYVRGLGNPPRKLIKLLDLLNEKDLVKEEFSKGEYSLLKESLNKHEEEMRNIIQNYYNL